MRFWIAISVKYIFIFNIKNHYLCHYLYRGWLQINTEPCASRLWCVQNLLAIPQPCSSLRAWTAREAQVFLKMCWAVSQPDFSSRVVQHCKIPERKVYSGHSPVVLQRCCSERAQRQLHTLAPQLFSGVYPDRCRVQVWWGNILYLLKQPQ